MLIRVAVPVPMLDLLTYRVPDEVPAPVGARVLVPLGARTVTGIVVESGAETDAEGGDLKTVRKVLDVEALVPADVVALARWTAEYYGSGEGETVTAVLPPMTSGDRTDGHKTRRVASITPAGLEALLNGLEMSVAAPARGAQR